MTTCISCGGSPGTRPTTPAPELPSVVWDYVALGDSFATGFGSGVGYPDAFADFIEEDTGADVRLESRAQNGATTDDLLTALQTDEDLQAELRDAEVVTWNIGGNDFNTPRTQFLIDTCGGVDGEQCLREAVSAVRRNLEGIFDAILALRQPNEAVLRVVGDYYPFVAEDRSAGTFDVLIRYVEEIDALLASLAREKEVLFADGLTLFNGPDHHQDPASKGFLGPDGVHPTEEGQVATAELLRDLGYEPLA